MDQLILQHSLHPEEREGGRGREGERERKRGRERGREEGREGGRGREGGSGRERFKYTVMPVCPVTMMVAYSFNDNW